jgi:hypothetical protein
MLRAFLRRLQHVVCDIQSSAHASDSNASSI